MKFSNHEKLVISNFKKYKILSYLFIEYKIINLTAWLIKLSAEKQLSLISESTRVIFVTYFFSSTIPFYFSKRQLNVKH